MSGSWDDYGTPAGRTRLAPPRNRVTNNDGARARLIAQLATHGPTLPYASGGQSGHSVLPRGAVTRGGLSKRALDLYRQRSALQGNPYMQPAGAH